MSNNDITAVTVERHREDDGSSTAELTLGIPMPARAVRYLSEELGPAFGRWSEGQRDGTVAVRVDLIEYTDGSSEAAVRIFVPEAHLELTRVGADVRKLLDDQVVVALDRDRRDREWEQAQQPWVDAFLRSHQA